MYNPVNSHLLNRYNSTNIEHNKCKTDAGASGNGSTDDMQEINSVISMAYSQNMNVYFPPGTYYVNGFIQVSNGMSFYVDYSGLSVLSSNSSTTLLGDTTLSVTTNNVNIEDYTVNFGAVGPSYATKTSPIEITIRPNPNNGKFELDVASETKGKLLIYIYNTNGQLVVQKNTTKLYNLTSIPMNLNLTPGIYSL